MAGKSQTGHGVRRVLSVGAIATLLLSSTYVIPVMGSAQVTENPQESKDDNLPFVLEAQGGAEQGSLLAIDTMPKALQHPVVSHSTTGSTADTVINNCEPFKPVTTGVAYETPTMIDNKNDITVEPIDIDTQMVAMGKSKKVKAVVVNDEVLTANIENTNGAKADDEVVDIYYAMAKGRPEATSEVLLKCTSEDSVYSGEILQLNANSRDIFERLVMGEAGNEGYEGAALVAQALRDTMEMTGIYDTMAIKVRFKYSGKLGKSPNEDVKRACSFILDEGGSAVKHRLVYFYAPKYVSGGVSAFHETQDFVIEWGGHRFFDKR